jgi:hypothetical protein
MKGLEKCAICAADEMVGGPGLLALIKIIHNKANVMSEKRKRASYTLEFKMEAVQRVKGGQSTSAVSEVLGIPKATLDN